MSEKRKNNKKLPRPSVVSGSPMDVDLLSRIVELMTENDVNTVDVRDGQRRVVIKRGAGAFAPTVVSPGFAMPAMPSAPMAAAPAPTSRAKSSTEGQEDESKLLRIKSPMVGTFYAAPSKGAKPFVTVGTKIEEDSDVCIIEAMKVFNNIKAECRGTITRILVQDSQPVEFGQTLFLVNPE